MSYSKDTDIKLGDVPWPSFIDKTVLMQNITDEIDSYIGFIYKTPVDVTENGPTSRPARLLLKRISIALSTGRAMMEAAAAAQDDALNAYARRMVDEALEALRAISSSKIVLDGAEKLPDEVDKIHGPLLYNQDERSQVEAFYDFFDSSNRKLIF